MPDIKGVILNEHRLKSALQCIAVCIPALILGATMANRTLHARWLSLEVEGGSTPGQYRC